LLRTWLEISSTWKMRNFFTLPNKIKNRQFYQTTPCDSKVKNARFVRDHAKVRGLGWNTSKYVYFCTDFMNNFIVKAQMG
jgi:hypothetical protein